jgi:hypothetical protein
MSIRRACVAGQFYPDQPAVLRKTLESALAKVPETKPAGEVVAGIAPHAGYVFSAGVAAYTHRLFQSVQFDTVVIIGHDAHTPGTIAYLSNADLFETPLGTVPVDSEMVRRLSETQGVRVDNRVHSGEHTVEVQLPFFQVQRESFKVVPVLFGEPTEENCRVFAEAILRAGEGRKVLVLASTDMSHYPPYAVACEVDRKTMGVIEAFEPGKLLNYLQATELAVPPVAGLRTALCASGGVGTAMFFARARGANAVQVLHYANSGDAPVGDKKGVVGYGAAVFVRKTPARE